MASAQYFADDVRNGLLDAIETAIGTAPILRLYNGTPPAHEGAALAGNTLLAEGALPSDWMAAASGGAKAKTGTWTLTGQTGAGAGTDATFGRIYAADGTTCKYQGTAGETADAPDLVLNNKNIADGQTVTVSTWQWTAPH
ncbi:hypothetical protein [Mycolicibacterium sp.]|uniref:hypothetical protein n=1 Tax=Mycolicibacterium sp. TaxID=2320850 RepID=UPI00355E8302